MFSIFKTGPELVYSSYSEAIKNAIYLIRFQIPLPQDRIFLWYIRLLDNSLQYIITILHHRVDT